MSPDWSSSPTAVPYANFQNPQSLNLYGYVNNNPLGRADVDGHFWKELWNELRTGCGCWTRDLDGARGIAELKNHSNYMASENMRNILARGQQIDEQRFVVTSRLMAGFMPGGGAAAEAEGVTVLGHYPEYVNLAGELNANYFSVPTEEWNALTPSEQWSKNQSFIDEAISRGDQFKLATPLDRVRPGSFYEKEIQHLTSKGYQLSSDGTIMTTPLRISIN